MKNIFIKGTNSRLLVLLHGTGGDEKSLIDVARYIDENASVLGIKGNISENGLNRFFRRIRPGIFDIDNLIEETQNLYNFINDFVLQNNLVNHEMIIIGYSNGANILGSMLYHFGKISHAAILMHPMIPIKDFPVVNQTSLNILITSGINDPLVLNKETIELVNIFQESNGKVTHLSFSEGHSISLPELNEIKKWYYKL
ncbi:MAG: carboxylesterase [Tenericutes bacterium HGW-Tenericutes-5]|jgi:phospholipase/carboxylesterase|nr:MAG: carboxylesterase [Tenericutes bacterium HGW-Tenericutes-5]